MRLIRKLIDTPLEIWPTLTKRFDPRFVRNFGYIGFSNIVYAASQWGIIVLVTKMSGVNSVARLALGLAVATPVMTFLGANLRVFVSIDVERRFAFGDYFVVRGLTNLVGLSIIVVFSAISNYSQDTLLVITLVGIAKVIEGFQEICWGIDQRADVMDPVGVSRLLRSGTCVLGVAAGLLATHNLAIGICFWALSWAGILVLYDLPKAFEFEALALHSTTGNVQNIIETTTPLAFMSGLGVASDKATQYQIAAILGESAVGFYAPLAYVIQGIGLAVISITEAATPRLAAYFHSNRAAYARTSIMLASAGALIGAVALAVLGTARAILLPILYTREFLAYQNVFLLLLVIAILRYAQTGLGVGVTAAGWLRQQVPVLVLGLVVILVTGWLWIPRFGMNGAAYSVGAGAVYLLVAYVILWMITARSAIPGGLAGTTRVSPATKAANSKTTVLHVLVRLDYGGIETWLLNVLKQYDREKFQMDICLIGRRGQLGILASRATAAGSTINSIPLRNPLKFVVGFRRLATNYDVVVTHVGIFYDPLVLLAARLAGVRNRYVMLHNTRDTVPLLWLQSAVSDLVLGCAQPIASAVNRFLATGILGCSTAVLDENYPKWREMGSAAVVNLGIDVEHFRRDTEDAKLRTLRESVGIPSDAHVIGHIGRFCDQKNHHNFVRMGASLLKRRRNVHFLLVGDGPLRPAIEEEVRQLGLQQHFHFVGIRHDVPLLMKLMEVSYFPSLYEGSPVTFIEAQVGGLVVVTGSRPEMREAICPKNHVWCLVNTSDVQAAAAAIEYLLCNPKIRHDIEADGRDWAVARFSIERSVHLLEAALLEHYAVGD